jgi:glutamyl-tRNA reductase
VCNRNVEKARALAARFGGEAAGLERLDEQLVRADVVVTSTGSPRPIITAGRVTSLRKAMRYRPIFMIDIALPRDIESAVGDLENVYLYNIDDLQQVVARTMSQRTGAMDAARSIIDKHVEGFVAAQRTREMGPLIDRLAKRYHALASEELQRTVNKLPNLGDAERSHLEELTRRIVNKLLHDPITMLRKSDGIHGTTSQYLHALERLFHLDEAGELGGEGDGD